MQNKISEIEKRKYEIEESQLELENILSGTIQKYTEEVNVANQKLGAIKKIILDKEKQLRDIEKLIIEKSSQVAEYQGLVKVLQKERATFEIMVSELKNEQNEMNSLISQLKDKENERRIMLHQLKTETDSIQVKKMELEREFKLILKSTNENFGALEERKKAVLEEIKINDEKLDVVNKNISESKNLLQSIKKESAAVEIEKERSTAKISELIAMEKALQSKIAIRQNDIEREQREKEDSDSEEEDNY